MELQTVDFIYGMVLSFRSNVGHYGFSIKCGFDVTRSLEHDLQTDADVRPGEVKAYGTMTGSLCQLKNSI